MDSQLTDEERRTVYCNNLDDRVTLALLRELFMQAGPVFTVIRPLIKPRREENKPGKEETEEVVGIDMGEEGKDQMEDEKKGVDQVIDRIEESTKKLNEISEVETEKTSRHMKDEDCIEEERVNRNNDNHIKEEECKLEQTRNEDDTKTDCSTEGSSRTDCGREKEVGDKEGEVKKTHDERDLSVKAVHADVKTNKTTETKPVALYQPYAFIVYEHESSVDYSIRLFHGTKLFDRPITLKRRDPFGKSRPENKARDRCVVIQKTDHYHGHRMSREEWEMKQESYRHDKTGSNTRYREDHHQVFDSYRNANNSGNRDNSKNNYSPRKHVDSRMGKLTVYESNYHDRNHVDPNRNHYENKSVHSKPINQRRHDNSSHGGANRPNDLPKRNAGHSDFFNPQSGNRRDQYNCDTRPARKYHIAERNNKYMDGNNDLRNVEIMKNPCRGRSNYENNPSNESEKGGRNSVEDGRSFNPSSDVCKNGFDRRDYARFDSDRARNGSPKERNGGRPDSNQWRERPPSATISRQRSAMPDRNRRAEMDSQGGTAGNVYTTEGQRFSGSETNKRYTVCDSSNQVARMPRAAETSEVGDEPKVSVERVMLPPAARKFLPYSSIRHPGAARNS